MSASTTCCSVCCLLPTASAAAIANSRSCLRCCCFCFATLAAVVSTVLHLACSTNLFAASSAATNAAFCFLHKCSYVIWTSLFSCYAITCLSSACRAFVSALSATKLASFARTSVNLAISCCLPLNLNLTSSAALLTIALATFAVCLAFLPMAAVF